LVLFIKEKNKRSQWLLYQFSKQQSIKGWLAQNLLTPSINAKGSNGTVMQHPCRLLFPSCFSIQQGGSFSNGEDRRCASRYTSGTFSNLKFPDKIGWVNLHDPALIEIAEGSDIVFWDLPELVVVVAAQGDFTSDGVVQGNGLRRCVQFRAMGETEPDGANAGKIKANAAHGAKVAKPGQTECALSRLASCRFNLLT